MSTQRDSLSPAPDALNEQSLHASNGELRGPESYVRNCLRIYRPGEKLFSIINDGQGPILARLDGYAIVPIGHYYDLIGLELPESLRQFQGDAQAFAGWNRRRVPPEA